MDYDYHDDITRMFLKRLEKRASKIYSFYETKELFTGIEFDTQLLAIEVLAYLIHINSPTDMTNTSLKDIYKKVLDQVEKGKLNENEV